MILRPPSWLSESLLDIKTRSVTAQEVTPTARINVKAANKVNFLNCVSPNEGPNILTRSNVPITYPIKWPTATIRLAVSSQINT